MATHPLIARLQRAIQHELDGEGKPWSARKISIAAGLSHSYVGNLLRGNLDPEKIGVDKIRAIASVLGVSEFDLRTPPFPTADKLDAMWKARGTTPDAERRARLMAKLGQLEAEMSEAGFENEGASTLATVSAATSKGRWRLFAARTWTFRVEASFALENGVPEVALDAASDELAALSESTIPSKEECARVIAEYAKRTTK